MSDCDRGVNAWYRNGRLITNVEMMEAIGKTRDERRRRYERDGVCCDDGPCDTGHCRHGGGICYLVLEARRLEWDMYHKEQWREEH